MNERRLPTFVALASLLVTPSPLAFVSAADTNTAMEIIDPLKLNANMTPLMEEDTQKQIAEAQGWKVFHDFQFSDHYADSGITFEHHVVDDAGKNWKPAHYDHGSTVAVADAAKADSIDVSWPSGKRQTITEQIPENALMVITESR